MKYNWDCNKEAWRNNGIYQFNFIWLKKISQKKVIEWIEVGKSNLIESLPNSHFINQQQKPSNL